MWAVVEKKSNSADFRFSNKARYSIFRERLGRARSIIVGISSSMPLRQRDTVAVGFQRSGTYLAFVHSRLPTTTQSITGVWT